MAIILANNATAKLAGAISTATTDITVQPGQGAMFPAPSAPDWFPVTLIDAAGNIEICKCTARSGDILTITRAQEGTSAKEFAAGSRVSLRITKAVLDYVFSVINPFTGLTPAADKLPYYTGANSTDLATLTAFARSLLDDADATAALSTLGVSNFIKALLDDPDASAALTTLGVSSYAKTLLDDADASTALSTLGVSTFSKTLLDDADADAARATLGAQAADQTLAAIAGLTGAADKIPYFTGTDTAALSDLTPFARTLLAGATAQAMRSTLGTMPVGGGYIQNTFGVVPYGADANFITDFSVGLGWAADAKPALVLLARVYSTYLMSRNGFSGRIHMARGGAGAGLIEEFVDVQCASGYNQAITRIVNRSGEHQAVLGAKIVRVSYSGENYYALYLPASSARFISATGIISAPDGGNVLTFIHDATAYTVTDVTVSQVVHTAYSLPVTDFAKTLLDDANASAMRDTIMAYYKGDATGLNLDTVTATGEYQVSGSSEANWPYPGIGGHLYVHDLANGSYVTQIAVRGGSPGIASRCKNLGTWGEWASFYSTITKPSAADVGAQPADATLSALAGLATAAGKFPYFTGTDAAALTGITTLARTFLEQDTEDGACIQIGAARVSSFRSVYGTNGYITLPRHDGGKIIIQWGKVAAMAANATAAVTFPTAFPSACDNIVTTPLNTVNTASMVAYPDSGSIKTTGFTMRGDTDNANTGVFWIAIGR